ncbi:MAG: hypothetical protein GY861_11715 [bacterium]|nr:hypothetical protein [bacterium]
MPVNDICFNGSASIDYTLYNHIMNKYSKGGNETMDKFISNTYEKTKDALLVQKHFGNDMPCTSPFLNKIVFMNYANDILAEAKRLEEASK